MNAIKRRWLILQNIPRHGNSITAEEIVKRLSESLGAEEIALRTVQRDLLELCDNSLPIEYSVDGRKYRYNWRKGHQLMVPGMDYHTALAFTFLKEQMAHKLPKTSLAYLEPFFRNAEETISARPEHALLRWKEKVRTVSRGLMMNPPTFAPGVSEIVYEALFKDLQITVVYRNRNKKPPYPILNMNPLGLVFVDSLIYLIATVSDSPKIKQYLLHRMESVTLLDRYAIIPEGFTLQGYIESGEFGYPVNDTIHLKALFDRESATYLYETPLPGAKEPVEYDENSVLLEADVPDNLQLRFWLSGFGDAVEILEPPSLRNDFKEMYKYLFDKYKPRK